MKKFNAINYCYISLVAIYAIFMKRAYDTYKESLKRSDDAYKKLIDNCNNAHDKLAKENKTESNQ